ncbi:hypothetical protein J437_LFUL012536 [Ladona fulva]|uniref:Uncharacterized protein n=1 Tax=Ladona fulva TaxID=123851 RepID=A0A8K0KDX4_LADFU|nr:hypothetical protein J437_LFUL012536 [Ladona fulva]
MFRKDKLIEDLSSRVNILEQKELVNEIEIVGLSKQVITSPNLKEQVIHLCKNLNAQDVREADIANVYATQGVIRTLLLHCSMTLMQKCVVPLSSYEMPPSQNSLAILPITRKRKIKIVNSLEKKSCGLDIIRVHDIKNNNVLADLLTNFINNSLETGKVPDSLKVAILKAMLDEDCYCFEQIVNAECREKEIEIAL